jgi:hypothetical protein
VASAPPQPDFPVVENPVLENPRVENQALLNNNNTNYTQDKKITAAMESSHSTPSKLPSVAAVSFSMKGEEEKRIGVVLTEKQDARARQVANRYASYHPSGNAQRLYEEIELTLLDAKSFTHAEGDFNKKLNTIGKVLREGKWSTPVLMQRAEQQRFNQVLAEMECQLRELNGDRRHLRAMLSTLDKETHRNDRTALNQQLIRCEKEIAAMEHKKKTVQERHYG